MKKNGIDYANSITYCPYMHTTYIYIYILVTKKNKSNKNTNQMFYVKVQTNMIHINSIDLFHWTNVISGRLWWCHSLRSHCCTGALVFQYWSQDDFRDKGDSTANGAYTVTADGSSGSSSLQISLKLLLRGSSRSPWSTSGRLIWNLASLPPFINTLR